MSQIELLNNLTELKPFNCEQTNDLYQIEFFVYDSNTLNNLNVGKQMCLGSCKNCYQYFFINHMHLIYIYTGWNAKIVVLKKTTLKLYFKTFIEKINSANLIM